MILEPSFALASTFSAAAMTPSTEPPDSVHVKREVFGEGHDRERHLGRGGRGALEELADLLFRHPPANVLVGDDDGARAPHVLVAARMVAVPVGIHHEADRARAYRRDRRPDLLGERGVLVVDYENPVASRRDPDVSSRADEHVDPGGDIHRLDLNL